MSREQVLTDGRGEQKDSWLAVFTVFLRLGCFSFGGPAAHLGYFRKSFVEQRRWLSDKEYGALVALSQFLPGPGSSQVGFALGMKRAGLPGGVAAFIGFTLPSFLLMLWLALATTTLIGEGIFTGLTHGLKLLAIVVVADACLGMFRSFCQQMLTRGLALMALAVLLFAPVSFWVQILLLVMAAIVGWLVLTPQAKQAISAAEEVNQSDAFACQSQKPLWVTLILMAGLLIAGFWITPSAERFSSEAIFVEFFRIGSLVFGGGHVVLPLMEEQMLSQMTADRFLTGYSLAQAVPGPMFTLASFMGAEIGWNESQNPVAAILVALVATLGIFLPGLMLMAALLPHWQMLSQRPALMSGVKGLNAVVVGFLLQALVMMVFITLVQPFEELSGSAGSEHILRGLLPDLVLIVLGWLALKRFNCHIVWLVLAFALSGLLMAL
ncbi:chromate efflux transporter [Oceanospirillum sanctuarii]|uniref:chromate efflux transporter n=1 Tax=Oceanospirillum sanctuarii TaxID=1434821 RepID=UPI001FED254C|nr:chromate efflux transporter [Oceanospirillum sanctuarii]